MKPEVISLVKRNTVVAAAFVFLLTAVRLVADGYTPQWMLIPVIFFCGFLWANSILIKRSRPISAAALSLALVLILALPVGIASSVLSRSVIELRYKTQGLQMVYGCNAFAAQTADFDVYLLNERLTELTNSPHADTRQMIQLRHAYAIAQEKVRILNDDCRRRGHCNSHPWKTSWVTIKEMLAVHDGGSHQ